MSSLNVYHYTGEKVPVKYTAGFDPFFRTLLLRLLRYKGEAEWILRDSEVSVKQRYEEFQKSDAPKWKKIATALLSEYSLVLNDDRAQVINALETLFEKVPLLRKEERYSLTDTIKPFIGEEGARVLCRPGLGEGILYKVRHFDPSIFKQNVANLSDNATKEEAEQVLNNSKSRIWKPIEDIENILPRPAKLPPMLFRSG